MKEGKHTSAETPPTQERVRKRVSISTTWNSSSRAEPTNLATLTMSDVGLFWRPSIAEGLTQLQLWLLPTQSAKVGNCPSFGPRSYATTLRLSSHIIHLSGPIVRSGKSKREAGDRAQDDGQQREGELPQVNGRLIDPG